MYVCSGMLHLMLPQHFLHTSLLAGLLLTIRSGKQCKQRPFCQDHPSRGVRGGGGAPLVCAAVRTGAVTSVICGNMQ